jgi:hypothetical protein
VGGMLSGLEFQGNEDDAGVSAFDYLSSSQLRVDGHKIFFLLCSPDSFEKELDIIPSDL